MSGLKSPVAPLTRRTLLKGAGAFIVSQPLSLSSLGTAESLGHWREDDFGMPAYRYTGPFRFPESLREDGKALLPDDPYFLLGNYRLTLFTHVSGLYEILSGESIWARLNANDDSSSGENRAILEVDRQKHNLVGLDSPLALAANKQFGVGFASYDYLLPRDIQVTRTISVAPSISARDGDSAFRLDVKIRNRGSKPIKFRYSESTRSNYQVIRSGKSASPVIYTGNTPRIYDEETVVCDVNVHATEHLAFPPIGEPSLLEEHPPALFIRALTPGSKISFTTDAIGISWLVVALSMDLRAGEEMTLSFLVGYTRELSPSALDRLTAGLAVGATKGAMGSAFADAWSRIIPPLPAESDPALRREMRWNAAVLEAMATWRSYYDETVVPQGTMYDYQWGRMMSSRDIAQQALPLCQTNPALARSSVRWLMKRMSPDGEIKLNDDGFGYIRSSPQYTSDQQLYFFLLLAEYLRVTRDGTILSEEIEFYPMDTSVKRTGLDHVRRAFLFVRDHVGTGPHGIVRRWNSDWNDMFFAWPIKAAYSTAWWEGESHMNSTMLVVIFGDLAEQMEALQSAPELTAALRQYRTLIYNAWLKDLGDRSFSLRAWTDSHTPLGDTDMWLEPQGYALLIPEFPVDRKRRLYAEIESRLLSGELMGARQIERPSPQTNTPAGTRENGGFWYALHGPVVLGAATFSAATAKILFERMTFSNFARCYPNYWTGLWSASDSLDSSKLPTGGLSVAIPYCAHAHSWPLYCYLRLSERKTASKSS